jgi:hypothetical protein
MKHYELFGSLMAYIRSSSGTTSMSDMGDASFDNSHWSLVIGRKILSHHRPQTDSLTGGNAALPEGCSSVGDVPCAYFPGY